jgi:hypothetical protein
MNELMSLNIEFKRISLDMIYDHLGSDPEVEQDMETQTSDSQGEDTEEEVQTDAATSRISEQLTNNENEGNDIEMK